MILLKGEALKKAKEFSDIQQDTAFKIARLNTEFQRKIQETELYKQLLLDIQETLAEGNKTAEPIAQFIYESNGINREQANEWVIDTALISVGVAVLKPNDPDTENPLTVGTGKTIH